MNVNGMCVCVYVYACVRVSVVCVCVLVIRLSIYNSSDCNIIRMWQSDII